VNIFFLSSCPHLAAQALADVHVGSGPNQYGKRFGGKMIIESGQMLANAYSLDRLAEQDCPRTKKGTDRKHSYIHHPCSKWAIESLTNWEWLLEHAKELVREKQYRGGDRHFTADFIDWAGDNFPSLPDTGFTPPALAMPEDYVTDSFVESYRNYYRQDKVGLGLTWTKRNKPEWM
jgi:hypothetical protein